MTSINLVSPYINTEFHTRISLLPHQMNNEIYVHLKNNLKKKVEKKCNKFGYITKLFKILDYSDGEIIPENFDSSAIFDIKYSCRVCLPIEKSNIICKIDLQNKALIKAVNGPIISIIKMNQLNTDKFSTNNKGDIIYNKNNHVLQVDDYIVISILALNFFAGDERQIVLGNLIDMPTEEEVKKFYNENLETEKIDEIDEFSVENSNTESEFNLSSENVTEKSY
mgnify:CR=1 FL=1